jgi:hypothetical protein
LTSGQREDTPSNDKERDNGRRGGSVTASCTERPSRGWSASSCDRCRLAEPDSRSHQRSGDSAELQRTPSWITWRTGSTSVASTATTDPWSELDASQPKRFRSPSSLIRTSCSMLILDRSPEADDATALLDKIARHEASGCVAAHANHAQICRRSPRPFCANRQHVIVNSTTASFSAFISERLSDELFGTRVALPPGISSSSASSRCEL